MNIWQILQSWSESHSLLWKLCREWCITDEHWSRLTTTHETSTRWNWAAMPLPGYPGTSVQVLSFDPVYYLNFKLQRIDDEAIFSFNLTNEIFSNTEMFVS